MLLLTTTGSCDTQYSLMHTLLQHRHSLIEKCACTCSVYNFFARACIMQPLYLHPQMYGCEKEIVIMKQMYGFWWDTVCGFRCFSLWAVGWICASKLYILLYEQGVLNTFEQSLTRFMYIVAPPMSLLALLKFLYLIISRDINDD